MHNHHPLLAPICKLLLSRQRDAVVRSLGTFKQYLQYLKCVPKYAISASKNDVDRVFRRRHYLAQRLLIPSPNYLTVIKDKNRLLPDGSWRA